MRLEIKDSQDNKRRLVTDMSLNRHELETTHPIKSKDDAKLFMEDIIRGWLDGEVLTPRQLQKVTSDLAMSMKTMDYNWRTHLEVLQGMKRAVNKLNRTLSESKKKLPTTQKRLGDYT